MHGPISMAVSGACGMHVTSDGTMHKTSGAHTHDDGAMHMPSVGESNRHRRPTRLHASTGPALADMHTHGYGAMYKTSAGAHIHEGRHCMHNQVLTAHTPAAMQPSQGHQGSTWYSAAHDSCTLYGPPQRGKRVFFIKEGGDASLCDEQLALPSAWIAWPGPLLLFSSVKHAYARLLVTWPMHPWPALSSAPHQQN